MTAFLLPAFATKP